VNNSYLDLRINKSGFVHTPPSGSHTKKYLKISCVMMFSLAYSYKINTICC
jgi:hypothetical protein